MSEPKPVFIGVDLANGPDQTVGCVVETQPDGTRHVVMTVLDDELRPRHPDDDWTIEECITYIDGEGLFDRLTDRSRLEAELADLRRKAVK